MNTIFAFVVEVVLTVVIAALVVAYLRPFLRKLLIDLCGTEDRAQFWTAFANILLIGMPVIFSLYYKPTAGDPEELFLQVAAKLSGNLAGFLFALIGVGVIVSFFALVSRRPTEAKSS
jgi:uncharacterized membrane protein YhaH (DUF805 family)